MQKNTHDVFSSIAPRSGGVRPMYVQLTDAIRENIISGTLPVGSRLPTEHELCALYGISRQTVMAALTPLVEEGLLYRRPRRGTFVAEHVLQNERGVSLNSRTIGFVMTRGEMHSDSFYIDALRGVMEIAEARNYHLQILGFDKEGEEIRAGRFLSHAIGGESVAGLIIASSHLRAEEFAWIDAQGIPVVFMGFDGGSETHPSVFPDYHAGSYNLTAHLLQLGHGRIALLGGVPSAERIDMQKRLGYEAALRDAGVAVQPEFILECAYHERDKITDRVLDLLRLPELPTAIIAADDLMAVRVISMLNEHRIRVPEEIAVVGFNDHSVARLIHPPLTTLNVKRHEMGQKTMETLFRRIRKKPLESLQITLAPSIVVRESCGGQLLRSRIAGKLPRREQ